MKRKADLDTAVGMLLGKPRDEVSVITTAFINEVMNSLIEDREVHIRGFGRILLHESIMSKPVMAEMQRGKNSASRCPVRVERRFRVYFKKAVSLTRKLHRRYGKASGDDMDKFAVDENVDDEKLEKAAADGCPVCGRKPERHGRVLVCPTCGSEPFEKDRS